MRMDRDLRKLVQDLHRNLTKEDMTYDDLARHPALTRLRNRIESDRDLLERLAVTVGAAGEAGELLANAAFIAALEREMAGEVGEGFVRELRRTLNTVLHLTRFGRDGEVFKQALMSLFLFEEGVMAVHAHPLIRRLFAEAAIKIVQEKGEERRQRPVNRSSLLNIYAQKKRSEYRCKTTADLVSDLIEADSVPPEELIAELVRRGREAAEPLLSLICQSRVEDDEGAGDGIGRGVGPACAILGEIGEARAVEALIALLATDLDEQAAVALARIGGGALGGLKGVLTGAGEDTDARIQAVIALTYLAYLHPDLRSEVVKVFQEALAYDREDDLEVYEWIISGLGDMGASAESREDIQRVYDRGLMEESEIDLEDALAGTVGWISVEDAEEDIFNRYRYVDEEWDEEISNFPTMFRDVFLEPQEPVRVGEKIGRNDPCPCGSGKKYKKCCGQ